MKDAGKKKEEAVAAKEDGDAKADEKKAEDKDAAKADAPKAEDEPAKGGSGATGKPARLTTNAKKQAKK